MEVRGFEPKDSNPAATETPTGIFAEDANSKSGVKRVEVFEARQGLEDLGETECFEWR